MDLYSYINKTRHLWYKVKTLLWYRLFLKACGSNNTIINPILLTPGCISLKNNIQFRDSCRIEGICRSGNQIYTPSIEIADHVNIEQNAHITCAKKISIGEYTAISANVTITDIIHPFDDVTVYYKQQNLEVDEVCIGKNCLILNNSIILPGSQIGDGCIVGGNTIVKKGIYPQYCLLVGTPAKIVKRYNSDQKQWLRTNERGEFI